MRNVTEKGVEKIETHSMFSIPPPGKSCRLQDNAEKKWLNQIGRRRQYNTKNVPCMPEN